MSRSQLREQICQTSKSDWQEWQSLVVLRGPNIFLNETNISILKFICGILNRGVANSFWNHVIQISSRQMYFQDIYSNLWKVKVFFGNIYSLKSNTYFWGTFTFVQNGFLYLIMTRYKLTVFASGHLHDQIVRNNSWPDTSPSLLGTVLQNNSWTVLARNIYTQIYKVVCSNTVHVHGTVIFFSFSNGGYV